MLRGKLSRAESSEILSASNLGLVSGSPTATSDCDSLRENVTAY